MLQFLMNRTWGYLAAALGVTCALCWSAYRFGLFFDNDFYSLEVYIFITLLVWLFVSIGSARIKDVPTWILLPLGICFLYTLNLAMGSESTKGTVDAMLRWATYGSWSLLLWGIWRSPAGRAWGWGAIQASGLLMAAGGWMGWFGWSSFTDIVLRFEDVELSATGTRLAGYMQYPNAYGAVMGAFLLMQLQAWAENTKGNVRAWFASVTIIPYAGALFLTESRGAIIAFVVGLGLAFFLHDRSSRSRLLLLSGIAAIGSSLMVKYAWSWMEAENNSDYAAGRNVFMGVDFWAVFMCAIVGAASLLVLHGYLYRITRVKNVVPWMMAALGIAVVIGVYIQNAGDRISGHYGTVTSRALFYKDAWEMFKDAPWLGHGGESWRMLVGLYQQQPYVGNEVHSGYIELGIDLGILGLAMLGLLLSVYVIQIWRYKKTAIAPAAVLFVHASVDFDWSYAYVWLLMIAWVMLHSSGERESGWLKKQSIVGDRKQIVDDGAWEADDKEIKDERARTEEERVGVVDDWSSVLDDKEAASAIALACRMGLALLLVCSAALGLWAAWRSDAAASSYAAAGMAAHPAARAAKLCAALDANPAWGRIRQELAPLLPLQERASLLAAGLRYEPHAPRALLQLGIVYAELGDVAQARSNLGEALRLMRFSREGHNAAIASMASLALRLDVEGDVEQMRAAAEVVVAMFEQFRKLDREVLAMDQPANGLGFGMTIAAKFHAAECLLLLQRNEEAEALLREIVQEDGSDWSEQALELLRESSG